MNIDKNARIPLIPLDYNNRQLAFKKELMVDYKTGKMYVVSAEDRTVIFDITAEIVKLINTAMPGDDIIVNIDGVGAVNLKNYLTDLRRNMLRADAKKDAQLAADYYYDMVSVLIKNGFVQINDFDIASERTVPVKVNGVLRWLDPNAIKHVVNAPVYNSSVVVKDNFTESTLEEGCVITLVADKNSEYNKLRWKVTIGNVVPSLKFADADKVVQEFSNDLVLKPNSTAIFVFESWDGGKTWFEHVHKFGSLEQNTKIDSDYMLDNYYTKPEVNDLIKWKDNKQNNLNE